MAMKLSISSQDMMSRDFVVEFKTPSFLKEPLTNVQHPPQTIPLEMRLTVVEKEIEDALGGKTIALTLSELGLKPEVAEDFVNQVRRKAKEDGIDLSDEEATTLANLMFLVGTKLAEESD